MTVRPLGKHNSACLRGWWVVPAENAAVPTVYELSHAQLTDRYNWTVEALLTSSGTVCIYEHVDRSFLIMDLDHATEPVAITALGQARSLPAPYVLKVKRGHWVYTEFPDYVALLEYVISLRHDRNVVGLPRPLTIQNVEEKDLPRPDIIRAVVNNAEAFLDEMVVFRKDRDVGLRYDQIGDAAPITAVLGNKWRAGILGAPFDEGFYDTAFDKATAKAYREVSENAEPAVSRVTGFMQTPAGNVYQRYIRVIVRLAGLPERTASFVQLESSSQPPYASVSVQ